MNEVLTKTTYRFLVLHENDVHILSIDTDTVGEAVVRKALDNKYPDATRIISLQQVKLEHYNTTNYPGCVPENITYAFVSVGDYCVVIGPLPNNQAYIRGVVAGHITSLYEDVNDWSNAVISVVDLHNRSKSIESAIPTMRCEYRSRKNVLIIR